MTTRRIMAQTKSSLKQLKPLCGDCEGFGCTRLIDKSLCKDNGKTTKSVICKSFQPNVRELENYVGEGKLGALSNLIAQCDPKELRALAALMYGEAKLRRLKLHFGQRIYIRYRGLARSNYLSNFMSAHVMSAFGDYVKVMSLDGKCVASFLLSNENQIYTEARFEKLKAKMIDSGKLVDPDTTTMLSRRFQAQEEYELELTKESKAGQLTTIDTVFRESKVQRRGNKTLVDLVDLANSIEQGYNVERDAGRYTKKRTTTTKGGDITINVTGN